MGAASSRPAPAATSEVVSRLFDAIDRFGERLATVVAEERYDQHVEPGGRTRTLRSDYALVRDPARDAWVGFRDTFDVDGEPVHDRADRLQQLVVSGELAQAEQIARESARFNIGSDVVVRNINVPTLVLELLQRRNRDRFALHPSGEEALDGVRTWRIDYRERERPTIIRTPRGRDQRSDGSVWMEQTSSEIRRTAVVWDDVKSSITVEFARVASVDAVVPVTMHEKYVRDSATITGDATYSNFRQFRTGARLVSP